MGELDIRFSADDQDLIKSQAKLIKQQDQMIDGYKKMLREAKKAAKDGGSELERFAAKMNKINGDPMKKVRRETEMLNQALKQGLINQDTYNRSLRRAGEGHRGAFGASAIANLSSYAGGVLSIGAAIGAITMGIRAYKEELNSLGDEQMESAPSLASLAQLADLSKPGDMERITSEAKKTYAEGGAKTLQEAVTLQKALASGDIEEWRAEASRLQSSGLALNAEQMVTGSVRLAAGFGKTETGSLREIVSKALGAAKVGQGEAEQLLLAAAGVSQQAGRLKLTDEELLAAVSTASAVAGPNEAETQMQSLLKGIEKEGLGLGYLERDTSLRGYLKQIQELEAAGEDIREVLGGRQEAIIGYGALTNPEGRALFAQNLANVDTAAREDWYGQRVQLAESVPENAAATARRRAEARSQLAASRAGTVENLADAVAADLVTDMRQKRGDVMATLQRGQNWLDRWMFGNTAYIRDYGAQASPDTQAAAERLGLILDRVGDKMDNAATRLEGAAGDVATSRAGAARANQAGAGGAVEAR